VRQVRDSSDDEVVFSMLRRSTRILTKNGIMTLIGQVVKVLLADGIIDQNEEKLMKEYMFICGIPQNLYGDILNRVNESQMT